MDALQIELEGVLFAFQDKGHQSVVGYNNEQAKYEIFTLGLSVEKQFYQVWEFPAEFANRVQLPEEDTPALLVSPKYDIVTPEEFWVFEGRNFTSPEKADHLYVCSRDGVLLFGVTQNDVSLRQIDPETMRRMSPRALEPFIPWLQNSF